MQRNILGVFAIALLAYVGLANAATNDELKELLGAPYALLALMFAGSLVSAFKSLQVARSNGSSMSFGNYLGYALQTGIVIFSNLIAFAVLVLTDQLNFTSALSVGYGLNSVIDLIQPKNGRAGEIAKSTS